MLAESDKLAKCQRDLYFAEQQLGAQQSKNTKLSLRIEELQLKYEPGDPVGIRFDWSMWSCYQPTILMQIRVELFKNGKFIVFSSPTFGNESAHFKM